MTIRIATQSKTVSQYSSSSNHSFAKQENVKKELTLLQLSWTMVVRQNIQGTVKRGFVSILLIWVVTKHTVTSLLYVIHVPERMNNVLRQHEENFHKKILIFYPLLKIN